MQNLTLSWVACRWLTDQLTNNSVVVSQPAFNEELITAPRPDGAATISYVAPRGSAAAVTGGALDVYGNPTVFSYVGKDQQRLTFNPVDVTNTGSIATFTQPNGTSLSFSYGYAYGGLNYLTQVSSNLGRSLFLSWTGPHVASVADGFGRSVSYGYDASGNLVSEVDPLGNVTRFAYDAASRLLQIFYPAQPGNAFITNSYDLLGRINGQANANRAQTSFYVAGSRTEMVDPASDRHVTYQSGSGKVLVDIGVLNNGVGNVFSDTPQQAGLVVARNQYDGQDRLSVTTSPEGGSTEYTYSPDFKQNLVRVTAVPKPGSGLAVLTTSFAYDAVFNKLSSVTDPLGLVMSMSYDAVTGNVLRMVRDAGIAPHLNSTTSFTYDAHGLLLTTTDPLGVVTRYAYDGVANPTAVVRDAAGLGTTVRMGYDGIGNLASMTDPRGNTATYTYDAARRRLTTTGPSTGTYPGMVATSTFDLNGNLTRSQQASGGMLSTAAQTFTATGKVATTIDANGNVTRYGYDAVDRLANVTNAVGRVTLYGYDALSRPVTIVNPAIQATPLLTRQYTPNGLTATLSDAKGNRLAYTYDGFDRLASTTYPATAAFGSTAESFTYDADGNVRTRTTRRGDTITYGYDTLNRLASKAEPFGTSSVSYAYDLAGHVTSVSDNGVALAAAAQATSLVTNASYDALNRPLSVNWSPVAAQAPPGLPAAVGFSHRYDATNRRIGTIASDSTWLAYPGPASTTAYSANALNQYSQVNAVTPAYDANGNLAFDGTFTYAYDAESRLVSVAQGGTAVASYAYDGRGRRKSQTVGGVTTAYVTGAEDQEVAEYDGATGAVGALYTFNPGGGLDDVLNRVVPGGARQTLASDIQGSIILSLDSGGALARVGYQPFGESASAVGSGAGPRYTGRRLDLEAAVAGGAQPSGLYYYRARTYSPTLGRFLQADPIGVAGGLNFYAYVGNDPLNLTDPFGLAADGGNGGFSNYLNGSLSALGQIPRDIGNLLSNPSQIPGAVSSALPGIGPVGELPQAAVDALGALRFLGAVTSGSTPTSPDITFQTEHYAPRLTGVGLDVSSVENTIRGDITTMALNLGYNAPVSGRMDIQGVTIEYRALRLPNGTINVGTIFPVR